MNALMSSSMMDSLIEEALMEEQFSRKKKKKIKRSCQFPPAPGGKFKLDKDKYGEVKGAWFTPKYKEYPSNIWHLAEFVLTGMLLHPYWKDKIKPSERDIRTTIRQHSNNRHFTSRKPMFMPRFGKSGCGRSRGSQYGQIYIPFKFYIPPSRLHMPLHR